MRILVVEDQPDLLHTLARTLREDGYAVDTADNGVDGLWKAESADYDAIVLDMMLPKLDGWELLRRLRQSRQTPVLVLTARDAVLERVRGLDTGADDYVIKPCDLDELLARLRALIRRSVGLVKPTVEIGEVTVDFTARTVSKAGQLMTLTAREFSVVEFLALHRGEVITRTQLYEHLLNEDDDTLSNVVDVHIYRIRKKIGTDFVQTRRGMGYCIG